MIIHDLFIKKDPMEFMPKPKDVEIDISDEAGQFKPIVVEKSEPKQPSVTAQSTSSHTPEEIVTAHPIADGVQWKSRWRAIIPTSSTISDSIWVRRC